jgi:hypothetical protein
LILLAVLLLAIGLADFARPQDRPADRMAVGRASVVGAIVIALAAWGIGIAWWWVPIGFAVLVAWVASTLVDRAYPWPIVGLGLAVGGILAGSAHLPTPGGWLVDWYDTLELRPLQDISFDRFALATACLVFLVESANIIVRMVLAGTDAGVMASEQTLKGGRVLGPIERIFIFAMALSGQYAALTAVVAAKGILRFPEISRDVAGRKAEYVLVGSFVSWAVALIFVPLL